MIHDFVRRTSNNGAGSNGVSLTTFAKFGGEPTKVPLAEPRSMITNSTDNGRMWGGAPCTMAACWREIEAWSEGQMSTSEGTLTE